MKSDLAPSALPVFPRLGEIAKTLFERRELLLTAETGAGKTTLVPWHLAQSPETASGKILLLEPRRVAARAAAERIAQLFGESLGASVGIRTRDDSIVGRRIEVITEAVLVRMLQSDPGLENVSCVIFDEFHERSLSADLALALCRDSKKHFRPDLYLLVMSATMSVRNIRAAWGDDIPFMEIEGRLFPVKETYIPKEGGERLPEGITRLCGIALSELPKEGGDILVFLPGMGEIHSAMEDFSRKFPEIEALALHGSMPPSEQRKVLHRAEQSKTRVIFATNVAETSLTLPAIRAVVDSGMVRRVSFSPRSGMNVWKTVPTSLASVNQRKGRAGRLGPGICYRYWSSSDYRDAETPPEILESDLAPLVLETAHWGALTPEDLRWITPPPEAAWQQGRSTLETLGFLNEAGAVTPEGKKAANIAVHPRLAKLLETGKERDIYSTACGIAALLETGYRPAGSSIDLEEQLAKFRHELLNPPRSPLFENAKREFERLAGKSPDIQGIHTERSAELTAIAYPERTARRESADSTLTQAAFTLSSGNSIVVEGPLARFRFIAAAEIDQTPKGLRTLSACGLDEKALLSGKLGPLTEDTSILWNGLKPSAEKRTLFGKLIVKQGSVPLPAVETLGKDFIARLAKLGLEALPWSEASKAFLARCRFYLQYSGDPDFPGFSEEELLKDAESWLIPHLKYENGRLMGEENLMQALQGRLAYPAQEKLRGRVPEYWTLPSGSRKKLDYESGEFPVLSGRLQEFLGCTEHPKLFGKPLVLTLLSPANRPIQTTGDINGFWDHSYPGIKKELKGRYPRHEWPDNPREAEPTSRAKPRKP